MGRVHRYRRRTRVAVVSLAGFTLAATGCGGDEAEYANDPRPASPIVVSASISGERVSVSPREFGAGPIQLIVTNQTERAQELTLETDEIGGSAPGIEQNSGPINPGDTASLKADLRKGTYKVAVAGSGIAGVSLEVGADRPSSQDELLQP
jgi:hypothetical protein